MLNFRQVRSIACHLRDLDASEFTLDHVRSLASRLTWGFHPPHGDDFVFFCDLPEGQFAVGLCNPDFYVVEFAISIHNWHDWDPEFHDSQKSFETELKAFDNYFSRAVQTATIVFGDPSARKRLRKSAAPNGQYCVWSRKNCLVYLYSDDRDLQSGVEIGFQIKTPVSGTRIPPLSWR